jgi:hypothetical protein
MEANRIRLLWVDAPFDRAHVVAMRSSTLHFSPSGILAARIAGLRSGSRLIHVLTASCTAVSRVSSSRERMAGHSPALDSGSRAPPDCRPPARSGLSNSGRAREGPHTNFAARAGPVGTIRGHARAHPVRATGSCVSRCAKFRARAELRQRHYALPISDRHRRFGSSERLKLFSILFRRAAGRAGDELHPVAAVAARGRPGPRGAPKYVLRH